MQEIVQPPAIDRKQNEGDAVAAPRWEFGFGTPLSCRFGFVFARAATSCSPLTRYALAKKYRDEFTST
jgi:hypothetical protein